MTSLDIIQYGSIIAVCCIYLINEWRKELRLRRQSSQKSLDKNIVIDSQIYPVLWELLSQHGAARVYIIQFHNGQNFYTGQSIQRMTISHEVLRKGSAKLKPTHDNVLMSEMMHNVLLKIQRNDSVVAQQGKEEDPELQMWMHVYDIKTLLYIRIIDGKTKETVAVLGMTWNASLSVSDIVEAEITETAKKLEKIFDEI